MAEPVRARRLTDQEGRRLLQIVRRGKHGSVRVRRAMIIMASASGTLVPAIARLVAADEDTVRDVIHTFNAKGLAALDPRPPSAANAPASAANASNAEAARNLKLPNRAGESRPLCVTTSRAGPEPAQGII
jgi:transposase